MTKRVFTYGCSVTQHIWPTWADIVLHSARINCYSVFNAGLSGQGNTGIKRSVIQTAEKYDITTEDTLLVMWTSWLREDRITYSHNFNDPKEGLTHGYPVHTRCGNVLNTPFYNRDFIRDYFNLDHYIINSISEINTVRKAVDLTFEGHIVIGEGIKHGVEQNHIDSSLENQSLMGVFNTNPSMGMPNPYYINADSQHASQYALYYQHDGHPVPADALAYVQQYVEPHLPFPIMPETIHWVSQWNDRLLAEIAVHGPRLGKKKPRWGQDFADRMWHYNKKYGVITHKDIWGGSDAHPERIDTVGILNQFIERNQNKG